MILVLLGASGPALADPAIERMGATEPVFVAQTMRCAPWDVPDTAARAWRDASGTVHLLASHSTNRAMVGPDLDHAKQDCRVLYRSDEKDAPALYDDRSWIASTYTLDGRTVYALAHTEFQGNLRPGLCPSKDYLRCWSNSLTALTATDGGFAFTHASPPLQLVAAPPYRYRGEGEHRTGYFNPSNILARDGFYYVFFWAEAEEAQRRGVCLMRTTDLADPTAWRGWNGSDFTVRFIDPYRAPSDDAALHVCAPIAPRALSAPLSSVSWNAASGRYVALMATERVPAAGQAPVTGIFMTTSPDLLQWSEPQLLWRAGLLYKFDCADPAPVFYPSLLDPASASRNFESVGNKAFIYLTQFHPQACRLTEQRDLVRIPVAIHLSAAASHSPPT